MILFDYNRLIHSITYNLCYQERIGRAYMVDESSLKYLVADYLAGLGVSATNIKFEYQHPELLKRLIDLVVFENTRRSKVHLSSKLRSLRQPTSRKSSDSSMT